MSIKTKSETYNKGIELAEQGNHTESLVYMKQYLEEHPDDAEALSDTGAVLFCLGETGEAIDHFKKAVEVDQDYGQSYWNLAEAYMRDGRISEAVEQFADMERLGILSSEMPIRAANHFLEQSDKGSAVEMMLKSIEMSEKDEVIGQMIEVVKSKRPKIAFFGIDESDDFYKFASERFMTESFATKDSEELADMINWCDIAWFGGTGEALERALALPKVCKIVINADVSETDGIACGSVDRVLDKSQAGDSEYLNSVLLELEKEMTA